MTATRIIELVPEADKPEAAAILTALRNKMWLESENNLKEGLIMGVKKIEWVLLVCVVSILLLNIYNTTNKQVRCYLWGAEQDIFTQYDAYHGACVSDPARDWAGDTYEPPALVEPTEEDLRPPVPPAE